MTRQAWLGLLGYVGKDGAEKKIFARSCVSHNHHRSAWSTYEVMLHPYAIFLESISSIVAPVQAPDCLDMSFQSAHPRAEGFLTSICAIASPVA